MNSGAGPTEPVAREGTLDDALANGRALLRTHPDMALRQAQAILARDPRDLRALRLAAAAHRALGEGALAERAELVAIRHSDGVPALVAARDALRGGKFGEASRLAAEHLRAQPDDLAAMTLSAESAVALGVSDKAEPILREILRRAPSFGHAQHLLANALVLLDRQAEAAELLDGMLAGAPDDPVLLNLLAKARGDLGDYDGVAALRARLVALGTDSPDRWIDLGDALRFAGRKRESADAYRKALVARGDDGAAWWSLADLNPANLDDGDVAQMERALASRRDEPDHAGNLHFALGLVHDAHGRHEEAFAQFAAGNRLRKEQQPYDPAELTAQVARQLTDLSAQLPARVRDAAGPTPVFIVGMPRSGSTLLERVLGRHSAIEALGELTIVTHIVERMRRDAPDTLDDRLAALGEADLRRLGADYLARAAQHARSGSPVFTDKLHMNWKHVPLILRMLPQALIVDLRRDPLDCCWSNFKTQFARGHPAANDLTDIGRFYADYAGFMDELRRRAPDRILFARYEDLVADLPGVVTPILEALGLRFEPAMRDFHLASGPVATASSEQVREPLNRKGIGAAAPYRRWLGPLEDALAKR